jgi:hypothetical protein
VVPFKRLPLVVVASDVEVFEGRDRVRPLWNLPGLYLGFKRDRDCLRHRPRGIVLPEPGDELPGEAQNTRGLSAAPTASRFHLCVARQYASLMGLRRAPGPQ